MAGATIRVLRESDRIADSHLAADVTSRHRFAALLEAGGEPKVLRERPELQPRTVDFDALRRPPAPTLDGAYVRHLDRHQLEILPEQALCRTRSKTCLYRRC
ncbi:MAG: Coq4 family protein [Myxococcota bacterium]